MILSWLTVGKQTVPWIPLSSDRPPMLRVRCFKVVGSLLSNQNTGMSENTTRIFIPHERSNSTQYFTTSSTRLVNTLDLRHLRPLPDKRNLSVTITTSVGTSLATSVTRIITASANSRDLSSHFSKHYWFTKHSWEKPSKNYTDSLIYFTANDSRTFRPY